MLGNQSGNRTGGPRDVTRRRFLSATAGSVVGAGVGASIFFGCPRSADGGYWSETPAAPSRAAIERLNLAAIGLGNRGADNLSLVKSEHIVALCDVDATKLARQRERFPSATAYRDFRELMEREDLDAVVVSTPNHTHFHVARLALEHKLHVYCEKPLTHSVWEVRQLMAAAKRSGVATQMGNQHHSSRGYADVVEWVRSGRLGEVREVHVWTNRPLWPQGVDRPKPQPVPETLDWDLWLGPAPLRPYNPIYHPLRWRGWWDFGGGALGDRGPHQLDPAYWALNLTLPTRISAESEAVNAETFPRWSIVRMEFPAVGDRPPVKLTWYDGDKRPPRDVLGVANPPSNGTLLVGSEASLFAPELGKRPIVLPLEGKTRPAKPKRRIPDPIEHHADWLRACKGGPPASSPFQYGGPLTETCLLGNIAIRTGRELSWDAERAIFPEDAEANEYLRPAYRDGWQVSG